MINRTTDERKSRARATAAVAAAGLLASGLAAVSVSPAAAVGSFVASWDTKNTSAGSSGSSSITLPLVSSGTYNFTVQWGDSSSGTVTSWDDPDASHTYADSSGTKQITITGTINGWSFNNSGDRLKLLQVSSWGPLGLGNAGGAFYGAENMTSIATDSPDLTGVTNLSSTFRGATNFSCDGGLPSWGVSAVTDMSHMFDGASSLYCDLSGWTTTAATDMSSMFKGTNAFDADLSSWDTSSVTDMSSMFQDADTFNQSVAGWDISAVTDMSSMFQDADSFNSDIGGWILTYPTTVTDLLTGAVSYTGTEPKQRLTPLFDTVTATADGFTAQVTNYDGDFTWDADSTEGTAAVSGTGLVTVSGLTPGQSATATVSAKRTGYVDGSNTVDGAALNTALTPTFDPVTRTADGFTAQVTNYDADFTWVASATVGSATVSGTGLLTVSGLTAGQSATATVDATRSGYADGSNTVDGTALLAALTPAFGSVTRTADGFTVQVTNFDPAYTWNATSTRGSAAVDGSGILTVTGVPADKSATATVTTDRSEHATGTADVSGTALVGEALVPEFGALTQTADGYKVQVGNFDPLFTWKVTATNSASASINGQGLVTVSGLAPGDSSRITVSTTRDGYRNGSGTFTSSALRTAWMTIDGPPNQVLVGKKMKISIDIVSGKNPAANIHKGINGKVVLTNNDEPACTAKIVNGVGSCKAVAVKRGKQRVKGVFTGTVDGQQVSVSAKISEKPTAATVAIGKASSKYNKKCVPVVKVSGTNTKAKQKIRIWRQKVSGQWVTAGSTKATKKRKWSAKVPVIRQTTPIMATDGITSTAPVTVTAKRRKGC